MNRERDEILRSILTLVKQLAEANSEIRQLKEENKKLNDGLDEIARDLGIQVWMKPMR